MENEEIRLIDSLLGDDFSLENVEDDIEVSMPGWSYGLNVCDESENVY